MHACLWTTPNAACMLQQTDGEESHAGMDVDGHGPLLEPTYQASLSDKELLALTTLEREVRLWSGSSQVFGLHV